MFSKDTLMTPPQKKSTKEKYADDKQWFKDCMDAYEYQALYYEQETHRKMIVHFNMDNGELDQNEMDFICANIYEEVFILYARKQFDLIIINMSMADGKHIYEQAKCIWAHSKYMAVCEKNQTVDVEFDCIINPHSDEESYKIKLWDIFRY